MNHAPTGLNIMIGFLSGKIHAVNDDGIVVDVAGVGYDVHVAKSFLDSLPIVGQSICLEIHTHVTESSFVLYGFHDAVERHVFRKLISVSGIGPKMALSVLSALSVADLVTALVQGQIDTLTRISGIGKKTAERMVIELKDKFKDTALGFKAALFPVKARNDDRMQDTVSALVNLGYLENQVRQIVQGVVITETDTVQTLIKKSLGALAK